MKISDILDEMKIECRCINEQEFDSLGLAGYNDKKNVCTFMTNIQYIQELSDSVVMTITNEETAQKLIRTGYDQGICVVADPRVTFFSMHNFLTNDEKYLREKAPTIIGKNCRIHSFSCISENNVVIGDNVIIEEFCSIKENTVIGDNSIIRAGSIIGSEGFEFKERGETLFRVNHVGGVIIGANVEIQSNCCIDKAIYPWDNTVIGDYSKLDNLIHVGHGVKIGKRTMIVTHSAIGGRTQIGDDCWLGIGAVVRNGLKIGDNARANMGAVVTKSIPENAAVTGNFAIAHDKFISNIKKDK